MNPVCSLVSFLEIASGELRRHSTGPGVQGFERFNCRELPQDHVYALDLDINETENYFLSRPGSLIPTLEMSSKLTQLQIVRHRCRACN